MNSKFNEAEERLITAADSLLNPVVGVNMTVNSNDIEVESEESVQTRIETALRAEQAPTESVVAALDSFKLVDSGSKYLQVKHAALADASIGIVGKAEYEASKDKAALLKSIVNDAFPQTKIAFEGSFVEPVIEKVAAEPMPKVPAKCEVCEDFRSEKDPSSEYDPTCVGYLCPKHEEERYAKKDQPEVKKSWLGDMEPPMTDLETPMAGAEFMEYECPVCKETFEDYDLGQHDKTCPGTPEVMHDEPVISISENMPRASLTDHLAQSLQLEDQKVAEAKVKLEMQAASAIIDMLQKMGFGSAKVAQVETFKEGMDIMTYLEDAGTTKAVNIPVTFKDAIVILPKRSLVATLVEKGLDVNAKLAESFSQEILVKMAEADEKAAYEAQEAINIINEKVASLDKVGGNEPSSQYFGTNEIVYLNKHLIPENIIDLDIGDTIHIDGAGYRLVSKTKDTLSRGKDDGSTWVFEKVTAISK